MCIRDRREEDSKTAKEQSKIKSTVYFNRIHSLAGLYYLVPCPVKMAAVGAAETSGVSENVYGGRQLNSLVENRLSINHPLSLIHI